MKKDTFILIGAVALLLFGGGYVFTQTRGLRNNNPGNIRHSASKWQGMRAEQTDSAFVQFTTPEYGIRALARVLQSYANQGFTSVADIIGRYAPSNENDTGAYINAVAHALNVQPGTPLDVRSVLPRLIPAIIRHENGIQPYSAEIIAKGISLA